MDSSLLTKIFAALKILALEFNEEGQLVCISKMPPWVEQEFAYLCSETEAFQAESFSPFLSNFLTCQKMVTIATKRLLRLIFLHEKVPNKIL